MVGEFLAVEGIVFDLDATLVNLGGFVEWREAHRRAVNAYLDCGLPEELISRYNGEGLFNMLNLIRDELSQTEPLSVVERIQGTVYDAIETCEVEGVEKCYLLPGCFSSLEWFREHSVRMGVATSNSQRVAERVLEAKGIQNFFSAIVGRQPELRMKPYPDQILKCFEEMGVDPLRGAFVGDSVRDIRAAKSAGIYSIAVSSFFTKREALEDAGVDKIILHLGELPRFISELNLKPG